MPPCLIQLTLYTHVIYPEISIVFLKVISSHEIVDVMLLSFRCSSMAVLASVAQKFHTSRLNLREQHIEVTNPDLPPKSRATDADIRMINNDRLRKKRTSERHEQLTLIRLLILPKMYTHVETNTVQTPSISRST